MSCVNPKNPLEEDRENIDPLIYCPLHSITNRQNRRNCYCQPVQPQSYSMASSTSRSSTSMKRPQEALVPDDSPAQKITDLSADSSVSNNVRPMKRARVSADVQGTNQDSYVPEISTYLNQVKDNEDFIRKQQCILWDTQLKMNQLSLSRSDHVRKLRSEDIDIPYLTQLDQTYNQYASDAERIVRILEMYKSFDPNTAIQELSSVIRSLSSQALKQNK